MELIFELVLQFLGEFVVQFVFEGLFEALVHSRDRAHPSKHRPLTTAFGHFAWGAVAGGLSLLIMPHALLDGYGPRLAVVILVPVAAAIAMTLIGGWRERRGDGRRAVDRFGYAYLFALAMALVRHTFAA
ncbi:hypothetical protein H7F50_08465 [Novosphingobium flavum]|uniref:hypothetical protein n=1 Tax=Novosphingobium aerophilum TaxID=2839843 RepID=UPI00163A8AD5|nr:hypothetical protein [Novosphingobium aerophilum]MBC2661790.1 hypothetical protein [Novosphingobium aerophilum]